MKKFTNILSMFLLIVGVIFFILPPNWFPSFYDVRYIGISALTGFLIIKFLPKKIRVSPDSIAAEEKNGAVETFQFFVAAAIVSNAAGDLGLYQLYRYGFEYDKLLHFGISLSAMLVFPDLIRKRFGIDQKRAIWISFLSIIMAGVLWEFYEFGMDYFWKTQLFGVYGSYIISDTAYDVAANTLGALTALFFVWRSYWAKNKALL